MVSNILKFGEYNLWCLINLGDDLRAAVAALGAGTADGIFISRVRGFSYHRLDELAKIQDLKILGIGDAEGVNLAAISTFRSLEYLSVDTGEGTIDFGELRNLRHLRLQITKERGLPDISFPAIRELALWGFAGIDLSMLKNFPSLVSLEMIQARRLHSLNGIEQSRNLESVMIAYCAKLENINALGKLTKITLLELENIKRVQEYEAIGNLKELSRILVKKAGAMTDLRFLAHLKKLKSVVLREVEIKSADLGPLLNLPDLDHIYLDQKKEYQPVLGSLIKLVEARAGAMPSC